MTFVPLRIQGKKPEYVITLKENSVGMYSDVYKAFYFKHSLMVETTKSYFVCSCFLLDFVLFCFVLFCFVFISLVNPDLHSMSQLCEKSSVSSFSQSI